MKPALTIACSLAVAGCGRCPSEQIKSYEPQGGITLRLEQSDCGGATSGFTYELRAYSAADEDGSLLLRFDNDHRHEWDDDPAKVLDVIWISPQQALIRLHYPVRVFKQRDRVDDTAIRYDFPRHTNLMTSWFGGSRIVG